MDNATLIWNYLKEKGFTDAGAAGIIGNLSQESALNPCNLQNSYEKKLGMTDDQYVKAVDNGNYTNFASDKAGFGLAQWTYSARKQNLLNFCKQQKKSIGDLYAQLDFLISELNSSLLSLLRTSPSVEQSAVNFMLQYERPANQSIENQQLRTKIAQQYYDRFKGGIGQMKYNQNNPPISCMLTTNPCYKSTYKMKIRGILWHDTGCNNPTIRRYVQPALNDPNRQNLLNIIGINRNNNDWGHTTRQVGVNAFIGKLANGTVATVQTMPWNFAPWGCASGKKGSCNDGWIQFEICEDNLQDKSYFEAAYKEAVELTAYLCKLYNINPQGTVKYNGVTVPTILCHQDSYRLGLGNNHSDVYDWFNRYGKTMDNVRADVAALLGAGSVPTGPKPANYQVKVTATAGLNCRATASTAGAIIKTYPYSTVLTISQENGGWGFTGEGWITLQYTQKITEQKEEEEEMTQEQFDEMMENYLNRLATQPATYSAEQEALTWAQTQGIMQGSGNNNLMPKKFLTRGESAILLQRLYNNLQK